MVKVKNWHGLLGQGTLKSMISQELIEELSCLFACSYKFRIAKGCFNNYWVGVGLLGHGTLKSGVLKNDLMNWADFLHTESDA